MYRVFPESLQHYTKMLKANCIDHSIYGAQAGLYIQLYLNTELWPLIKLLGFHTEEVSTTKLIVHLTQPAVAVARVWKSPVLVSVPYGSCTLLLL